MLTRKTLLILLCFYMINANAAFVDNGVYTTDSITGLQWLKLTETAGITSYSGASGVFSTVDGGGWRYATNAEVEGVYSNLFGNPVMNGGDGSGTFGTATPEYANILSMHTIFGTHHTNVSGNVTTTFSRGAYEDENGILRWMGSSTYANTQSSQYSGTILGPDYVSNYDSLRNVTNSLFGIYAVRGGSPVPIPAAFWLFGSALAGFGFLRRKSR